MLIKTIVSSNLADAIAKEYNLELIEVLTGFKNIGKVMKNAEWLAQRHVQIAEAENKRNRICDQARRKY